jgi:imidazolonepropionase
VSRYHGLSADHIEYLTEEGVAAMRESGTVAVLLPGAFYFLNETRKPPVELLRKYQVPMAVATDFNPGTSPFASLHLAMNMACVKFGLTPEEAWAGVTRHAAQALGRQDSHGQLAAGFVLILPSGMLSIRSRWCMSRGAARSGSAWFEEKCNDAMASYARQSLAGARRQRGSA